MFVDAGTFLGSATCILLMRMPRNMTQAASSKAGSNPLRLADGVRYMLKHKRVLQVIGLMLLFWACGGLMLNGLTGIVTHEFGLNISNYSYFMGIVGLGMIVGAADGVGGTQEGVAQRDGDCVGDGARGRVSTGIVFDDAERWNTALAVSGDRGNVWSGAAGVAGDAAAADRAELYSWARDGGEGCDVDGWNGDRIGYFRSQLMRRY